MGRQLLWQLLYLALVALCRTNAQTDLKNLVQHLDIPDSSITASGYHSANYEPYRVRIDKYFDKACAWAGAKDDVEHWIQFDMGVPVTVSGVLMKPRCDKPYDNQRVLSFNLKGSNDGLTWFDALDDTSVTYVNGVSESTLSQAKTGRFWRINVLAWNVYPSMKADLIGDVAGA